MKKSIVLALVMTLVVMTLVSCVSRDPQPTATPMTPTGTPTTGTPTPEDTSIKPPEGKDNYIDSYYAESVIVKDPYGRTFDGDGDSEILKMLLDMTKNAKASVYLGFTVDASKYYEAEFDGPAGKVTYRFYFSGDPEECYFRSGGGKYYYSNAKAVETFMKSDYSEAAYTNAAYPEMTVGEVLIKPKAITWKYKKINGEYSEVQMKPSLGGGEKLGELSATFKPVFTIEPTTLSAKVTDKEGTVLYEGGFEELCYIIIKIPTEVDITVKAKWEESEESNCAGEAEYSFGATMTPSASFTISKNEAIPGELLILTCTNPDVDLSKISVKSSLKTQYEVKFFPDKGEYRALLPIPLDATGKGITYTVKAYGDEIEFFVALNQRTVSTKKISRVTEELLKELNAVSNPYPAIFAQIKDEIYANTNFARIYGLENFTWAYTATKRINFSDLITYSEDTSKTQYTAYDYAYVGTIYDNVTAVAPGRVVYVGTTEYTGGLIVIDHGMGLLSWYWNLSDSHFKVVVGQEVTTETVLGRNGGGGLTEAYKGTNISIHSALTVYDVPIDLGLLVPPVEE